jgi:hypothetical protein
MATSSPETDGDQEERRGISEDAANVVDVMILVLMMRGGGRRD